MTFVQILVHDGEHDHHAFLLQCNSFFISNIGILLIYFVNKHFVLNDKNASALRLSDISYLPEIVICRSPNQERRLSECSLTWVEVYLSYLWCFSSNLLCPDSYNSACPLSSCYLIKLFVRGRGSSRADCLLHATGMSSSQTSRLI